MYNKTAPHLKIVNKYLVSYYEKEALSDQRKGL